MSQTITPITNLLVIDSQVSDWQGLASAATAGSAVLILDSGSDGLTQISDYLTTLAASTADFVPLQSIQIMSHGSAGTLLLGSSTISQDNLSLYSEQLASMGSNLTDTGDILLYGCDVAANQNGVDFINQLAVLTNADVAASTDLTGSAALGGDWQLEASTGTIESGLALNTEAVNSYADTLSIKVKDNLLSEAYLSVYDTTSASTFVLDLGLTMGDLVANLSNDAFSMSYNLTDLTANSTDGKWSTFAANLNTATTVFGVLVSGNGGRLLATGPAISPEKFATITVAAAAVTTSANHIASVNTATQIDNPDAVVNTALNLSAIILDSDTPDTGQHDLRNTFASLNGGKTDAGASINYGTAGNFYYYSGGSTQIVTQAVQTWSLDATTGLLTYSKATVTTENNLPTGAVTITGTATQGEILTAGNNVADIDGLGTITYQWFADGTAITNATAGTLTLSQAEVGKGITVKASYIDQKNTAESVTSSATTAITAVAHVNTLPTGSVTITGTATQNEILTATNTLADVDGLGTISYQWLANGTTISGATASTLTLGQAEVGKTITVTAGYTDQKNTAESVTSSATGNIVNVNDAPTGTVTISGTAEQNQILTAVNTLVDIDGLDSTTITYQWLANGTAISGAISSTLTLGQTEVGKAITVKASYTDLLGTTESMTSSATSSVGQFNNPHTGTVTISGTATQNEILTAISTLGDLDGMGTIAYQWYADQTLITDATAATLTLGQAQVGKVITVTASYTDGLGKAESVPSSPTIAIVAVAHINTAPTGAVTITGTASQNEILTAVSTLVDIDGLGTISYQWLANGTAISGATASTLTLTQAQVDKTITVTASYTDLLGTPESVTSTTTTAVVNVNDAPTTSVVTLASILEHSQARVITQAELLGNAVDLDANTLTATGLSLASSNGTLVDNANGTWSYTPLLNDATSVSFNYTITDSVSPTAGTVAATATLDITPVQLTAEPVADLFKSFGNGTNEYIKPEAYVQNSGQNLDLKYQIIDKSADAVIIGSTSNDFIKLAGTGNKAANGGAGNDVLDGSTGSSFLSGGDGINTFFMDGRATGVTWSTLTDFTQGQDKATIWGWVKGVSTINAGFTDFNTGGATDYTGLTLHIQNLLPDGSVSGATNSALNSLTLTGHTLAQFGASSLADLNTQIINGTNTHFIVGQTTDDLGVHGFLSIS